MPLPLRPAVRFTHYLQNSPAPHSYSEEWKCRFCSAQLPDYRKALSQGLPPPADCALASIHHGGKTYSMQVRSGLLIRPPVQIRLLVSGRRTVASL